MKSISAFHIEDPDLQDVEVLNTIEQLNTLSMLRKYRLNKKERALRRANREYLAAEQQFEKVKLEFSKMQSLVQQARNDLTHRYTNIGLTLDDMRQWNMQECDLGSQLMSEAEKYQKQDMQCKECEKQLEECRKQRLQADIDMQRLTYLYQAVSDSEDVL